MTYVSERSGTSIRELIHCSTSTATRTAIRPSKLYVRALRLSIVYFDDRAVIVPAAHSSAATGSTIPDPPGCGPDHGVAAVVGLRSASISTSAPPGR